MQAIGGWEFIRETIEIQLRRERERIYAEIHEYPPPIPACDAQFNYLIEKRAIVGQELGRVRALAGATPNTDQQNRLLREWVTQSQILSQATKAEIVDSLEQTIQLRGMTDEQRTDGSIQ